MTKQHAADLTTKLLGSSHASEARAATLSEYDSQLAVIDAQIAKAEALIEVEACRAHEVAMRLVRDAVDNCCSAEWRIAQGHYAQAVQATSAAFDRCYALGALPKPFWM